MALLCLFFWFYLSLPQSPERDRHQVAKWVKWESEAILSRSQRWGPRATWRLFDSRRLLVHPAFRIRKAPLSDGEWLPPRRRMICAAADRWSTIRSNSLCWGWFPGNSDPCGSLALHWCRRRHQWPDPDSRTGTTLRGFGGYS